MRDQLDHTPNADNTTTYKNSNRLKFTNTDMNKTTVANQIQIQIKIQIGLPTQAQIQTFPVP